VLAVDGGVDAAVVVSPKADAGLGAGVGDLVAVELLPAAALEPNGRVGLAGDLEVGRCGRASVRLC
jgi:hypothetical protein